ncbi:heptaprenyl diphosphate synthase component 1 [Desulfuribacillus alkaliarsenatis]|uniref:Heptaprenyl diphosphate synthase n=1 Tax=Desulfuribacillus alkaliarsenatis TaxID=766136 RepID=A0A1E5G673_9FIRM|nr:heptaprenyl diphosphate synthase component 1 [Desulfuribacillus alkaliarsenatis]OEF98698.1 hypothetical protein BHF68_03290 [Desulfuribacillus alkaliarsenatis]
MQIDIPKIVQKHITEVNHLYKEHSKNLLLNQHFSNSDDEINDPILSSLVINHIMLQASGLSMTAINNISVASALIESALDIHQQIEKFDMSEVTSRQLTVLAGDYYSSKYYKLLSDENMIREIQVFAKAIQQINEAKMTRHFASYSDISVDQYLVWLKEISTAISQQLVEEFAIDKVNWLNICSDFTVAQTLIHEDKYIIPTFESVISFKLVLLYDAMGITSKEFQELILDTKRTNELYAKHNINQIYNNYINQFLTTAIENVEKLQTKYIKDELNNYINKIRHNYMSLTAVNK